MDNDYSKREIDIMFQEIKETLARIEAQTKKTNGSVMSLQLWRSWMIGGMGIITLIVIPLLFYINQIQDEQIQNQQIVQNTQINQILKNFSCCKAL